MMLTLPNILRVVSLTSLLISPASGDNSQNVISSNSPPQSNSKHVEKIAIIGAGAAGSSAAYHLFKFAQEAHLDDTVDINIEIFESNSYIGGRSTTVDALNDPRYPVELGASIFVEINQILFNASKHFSLTTNQRIFESTGADYDLGVWDGDSFVFTTGSNSNDDDSPGGGLRDRLGGWWDIAKILWKYGLSPIRLRSLQQSTIGRFLQMYDDFFPFADLTQVARDVGLLSVTGASGEAVLAKAGISEQFSREIIQASTRVNYAQNLQDFHGLETLVCMSTDGAMSVEGGNWQIFDKMIKAAGAKLRLNTTVTNIATEDDGPSSVTFADGEGKEIVKKFDTIILAHPYNDSMLAISPAPKHIPGNDVEYVELYVTLFTSPFRPSAEYFGLNPPIPSSVPDTILTTIPEALDPDFLGRGVEGVGPAGFWSLSTLRILHPSSDGYIPGVVSSGHIPGENLAMEGPQYLYKVFSPTPMTADDLSEIFGWDLTDRNEQQNYTSSSSASDTDSVSSSINSLSTNFISWSYEKMWYSYPYLPPRVQFDCFDIYNCPPSTANKGGLAGKLWYTNAMESFISTMETSALSGRNIARLIVDGLVNEQADEGKSEL